MSKRVGLWLTVACAAVLKIALTLTASIGFHSDEAIMMLMARHILQGARPIFTYGQSYMGTLDSYLIAGVFRLLGERVATGRLIAPLLYLGVTATTYLIAWRLASRDQGFTAMAAGLLSALPPVMVSLYTSISMGPWIEILLLNNMLLLLGWDLLAERRTHGGWWLLAGLLAGIGWWELPLIGITAGPLVLLGVWTFRKRMPWAKLGLAALGFLLGALPWIAGLARDPAAVLGDMVGIRLAGYVADEASTSGLPGRLLSLMLFNLPSLFGLRPSWSVDWILLPVGLLVAGIYLLAIWTFARQTFTPEIKIPQMSLAGAWILTLLALLVSSFGSEPTGRYLLVLHPSLAVITALWLEQIRQGQLIRPARRAATISAGVLAVILAFNLWGNVRSMAFDTRGLSTQLSAAEDLPNRYDAELIGFLDSIHAERGYSNFWVTFRLAFLTDEQIILAPALPYKPDRSHTDRDNRYPSYTDQVQAADDVVYVTANLPELDAALRAGFERLSLSYQQRQIGPYTVFYDLPRPVRPEELDIYDEVSGQEMDDLR